MRGAWSVPRGAKLALGDRALRRWMLSPVVLAMGAIATVLAVGTTYLVRGSHDGRVIVEVVAAMVLGCVGAFFLALTPFGGALSDRTEVVATGTELPRVPVARWLAESLRGLGHLVSGFVLYVATSLALLTLAASTPFLAPVWALVHLTQTALFVAYNAFDPALSRRTMLGFGTLAVLLLAIPFVGFVLTPITVVAATTLVLELEKVP